jgi:prepilin-type N-terminal cleavage/methylation domain-containing protein
MKRGFTLIELLVYMAIMGFIIVVAGRVYSDSTSMRVRTQNMTAAMEEVNKVAALIKEDLSQMGAKEYKSASSGKDVFVVVYDVYMKKTTGDSSSFDLVQENGNSKITFKKIAFDSDGKYNGIREITWKLGADSVLTRSCISSYTNTPDVSCLENVEMATKVAKFTLIPSTPGAEKNVSSSSSGGNSPFDAVGFSLHNRVPSNCSNNVCSSNIDNAGNASTVKVSTKNTGNEQYRYEIFVGDAGDLSGNCRKYTFKKNETYTISFRTPLERTIDINDNHIASFQPEVDHASIGFRKTNGDIIPNLKDFMFYFPQTFEERKDTISHHFEFSVEDEVKDACATFTLAFYSPTAWLGDIRIGNFKVVRKDEAYHFVRKGDNGYDEDYATTAKINNEDVQNKKKVKAFELHLEINKRGEKGSTIPVENSNGFVIPTPNNGLRPLFSSSSS